MYALPGTKTLNDCKPAVFLTINVSVPIVRQSFDATYSMQLQKTIAKETTQDLGYVSILGSFQSYSDASSVIIISVATSRASEAMDLMNLLNSRFKIPNVASELLLGGSLNMIQISACPSGYQLLQSQTCGLCPAKFYCLLGSALPCAAGYFSPEGSNTSGSCRPVTFVLAILDVPLSPENFANVTRQFQVAIALTVHVMPEQVVLSFQPGGRRYNEMTQVRCEIATDSSTPSAASVAADLGRPALNSNLAAQGIPNSVLESATYSGSGSNDASSAAVIIGSTVGVVTTIFFSVLAGYYLIIMILKQSWQKRFSAAVRDSKIGQPTPLHILPFDLRKLYAPKTVLGKGAFGCVVLAAPVHSKSGNSGKDSTKEHHNLSFVAIKIVVPPKGAFVDREMRQLHREKLTLERLTLAKCEHAVIYYGAHCQANDVSWFVMEYLEGEDLGHQIKHKGPCEETECIKAARSVLAVLKVMHSDGVIHRDVKPSNVMQHKTMNLKAGEKSADEYSYKLIDFGTAIGIDEKQAIDEMMTKTATREMGVGTLKYMSPEMITDPDSAKYPTDLWSLGVTMFELITAFLPFKPDSEMDLLWIMAIAGDMDTPVANVLDVLGEDRRAVFDHNLAKVIAKALEKRVGQRFQAADEMHDAIYSCLISKGEAYYSAFISYRVASEMPLARLLFDDLNHTVTPGGHRVTVFWDAHRLVKGEDWEESFALALLNSLCVFPLLSFGATAPMASLPEKETSTLLAKGWDIYPLGKRRLQGLESDSEDNVLKELLIAGILMDTSAAGSGSSREQGMLQTVMPVLVGRQEPEGHKNYPGMGSFFEVECGGGEYPKRPSPPTNRAVVRFLRDKAGFQPEALEIVEQRSIAAAVSRIMSVQGLQLWNHDPNLQPVELSQEQKGLIGKGCAGPAVDLGGVQLTEKQRAICSGGLSEIQLQMLKAQVRSARSTENHAAD